VIGKALGPYHVVALLGEGGMGEVYRARDTRLERDVAIKVLSAHLVDSSDARDRFQREARAVAALQHPNICTIHDASRALSG
jgi:serine/threonine protein kinase